MARPKSVWGIDLGQCALKAIKVSYDAKEDHAIAEAFDYIEHPKILSQPDAEPDELIRAALTKFLSRNDVKESLVYISIPGQAGLARFVQLPPVEAKKVPEIVAFEAKQQIPFPLEDCIWDWQRLGSGEEEEGFVLEAEVGVFAIKRDMVMRHLAPYLSAGLEIDVVQLAPLAVYNFAAFDHFYHGQKNREQAQADGQEAPEEEEGDAVVILDMGADKTDVIVTDGDSIWNRNLPIGGNHFTRALTKDLKLTFAKAEHLKRNATKAADPKKLYQAMRPVFQDFASELQRSIGYFQSTHRDREIREVLGVGNGFKLPGLQKFLQANLEYKVRKASDFQGLGGDEILGQRAFSDNMLSFCVAYGLALQGLGQTPLQTNLLPREIGTARLIRAKKPWSLTAAAALLLGCAALFVGNYRVYSAVNSPAFKQPTEAAKSATTNIAKMNSDFEAAKGQFNSTKDSGEKLIGKGDFDNRLAWIGILKKINDALPRRNPNIDDTDLESVPEINVEEVEAVFQADLSGWCDSYPESVRSSLAEKDKENPVSGEGWIFQVLGYTYHREHELYVMNEVVTKFQTDLLRQAGMSHALLYQLEVDESWTPKTGSPLRKFEKLAKAGAKMSPMMGSSMGDMSSGSEMMSGMTEGDMANMAAEYQNYMPEDVQQMMGMDGMMGPEMGPDQSLDVSALLRTDFSIRFVWVPKKPEQESEGN